MELVLNIVQLRIFLALLCSVLSSAERLPWFWSREALSELEKPCGSLIRPNEGGQQPEVFRFQLHESPSVSFWKRANEVEESVSGECAVAIVAPKSSSRLAVGVDLAAVEGAGHCLSSNHIALYDLQGGRLILKDTICGWQKAASLMEITSHMALITINLEGVKKGSFILKVSVLREGEYPTTTGGNLWVLPTTATPEKYQEHTEVFLVPETTEPLGSSEEQTTESIIRTTKDVEETTPGTTIEDADDKEMTEEGFDPVRETTTEKGKKSTTEKPDSGISSTSDDKSTESPGDGEEIEGSGFGLGRTTEKPSGGSGIEFVIPSGNGDRRTTTKLPAKPGGSGIEFLIPSASGEGRTTERPGGSGIVFLYPSGHGVGRTTANYHGQSNGDYISNPWAETSQIQGGAITGQSTMDNHANEAPTQSFNQVSIGGTTPNDNLKETEYSEGFSDVGNNLPHVIDDPENPDLLSDEKNTNSTFSGTTSTTLEKPSVKPPRPGIEFVYPGRPSFALVSDNPSLLPDFPIFSETTARTEVTTRSPKDSGIVFVFHEEPSSPEKVRKSVLSIEETGSSKEFGAEGRILNQRPSTLPSKKWPTLSVKWKKRFSTPSFDMIDRLRKEAESIPNSTAMTPEYLRLNHSKIAEVVTASSLMTGGKASENSLGKGKKPLRKKVTQIGLRNSSQEAITTKSHKRDPWSGIQLEIPKKVVTSSLNKVPITSTLTLTHINGPSISSNAIHRPRQRNHQTSNAPPLFTTDRNLPLDPTNPIDASLTTKKGKGLDTIRQQTEASE